MTPGLTAYRISYYQGRGAAERVARAARGGGPARRGPRCCLQARGPSSPPFPAGIRDAAERVCHAVRTAVKATAMTSRSENVRVRQGTCGIRDSVCGTRMSNMILPSVACDEKRMTHRWDRAREKDARIAWSGIA